MVRDVLIDVQIVTVYIQVTGSNWIELPAGTYRMRQNTVSHTQIEVEVQYVYETLKCISSGACIYHQL
jgi:succinate dehydrogenase/fumarate reductase-like Fe-S protein